MKKTINVAQALLVRCDKAKNIRVGFYVLLTFNRSPSTPAFNNCVSAYFYHSLFSFVYCYVDDQ